MANKKLFTIGSAADGSAVTPVDLERQYGFIVVVCRDCTGVDSAVTATIKVDSEATGTMQDVYAENGGAILAPDVPGSGTWRTLVTAAFGARRVQIVLSAVTTAAVVFEVWGFDNVQ